MSKVTIITGYYNRAWCVDESIQSLLDQTYDAATIIAFDDYSTDETFAKLSAYNSDKFHAVRLPKNMGFVNGLIYCINEYAVDAQYIAIHGSGDISHATRVQKQVEAFQDDRRLVIVGSLIANVDKKNGTRKEVKLNPNYTKEDLMKANPFSHGEIMFRKDAYDSVGGYRSIFEFSQDYDLWLRLLETGTAKVIQEVLYERNIQFDGVSYNPNKLIRQELFSYLARHINKLSLSDQRLIENRMKAGQSIYEIVDPLENTIQKSLFLRFNVLVAKNKLTDAAPFTTYSKGKYKKYFIVIASLYKYSLFRSLVNSSYIAVMKIKLLVK